VPLKTTKGILAVNSNSSVPPMTTFEKQVKSKALGTVSSTQSTIINKAESGGEKAACDPDKETEEVDSRSDNSFSPFSTPKKVSSPSKNMTSSCEP